MGTDESGSGCEWSGGLVERAGLNATREDWVVGCVCGGCWGGVDCARHISCRVSDPAGQTDRTNVLQRVRPRIRSPDKMQVGAP